MNNGHYVITIGDHVIPPVARTRKSAWTARTRLRVRHFELLVALGAQASVHAASRALNMTQPAASKLLKEVEEAFGATLFERARSGVKPTIQGELAVERARLLLKQLEGTHDALAALAEGHTGIINVGIYAVAAPVLLPAIIALLRKRGSRLRVRIEEAATGALLLGLREGRLDCVIGRLQEEATDDLLCQPLYDEDIVLVARPGHPLARKRRLDWQDAMRHEWILPPPGTPLRAILRTRFANLGLPEPACTLESVSLLTNVSVISQSDAVVMLPAGVALHYERLGLVQRLALQLPSALPPVGVILRKALDHSAALAAFLAVLADASGKTRPGSRGTTRVALALHLRDACAVAGTTRAPVTAVHSSQAMRRDALQPRHLQPRLDHRQLRRLQQDRLRHRARIEQHQIGMAPGS